jgi:hypothetical protein
MEQATFDHPTDWRAALYKAINTDTRQLDWFDVDLSESIAHEQVCTDRLKSLLVSSPLVRIRLLLQSDTFFWQHCTRLASLQLVYGHAFEIRVVDESDMHPAETFLLVDQGVVRRFHPDAHRGEYSTDGRARALCRQTFHSMWQRAQVAQSGRRLGI